MCPYTTLFPRPHLTCIGVLHKDMRKETGTCCRLEVQVDFTAIPIAVHYILHISYFVYTVLHVFAQPLRGQVE